MSKYWPDRQGRPPGLHPVDALIFLVSVATTIALTWWLI